MDRQFHQQQLVRILQAAYSGELAAAYAYRGHWKSLSDAGERDHIRRIENEEWLHRRKVGAMLAHFHAAPVRAKEIRLWVIGRAIGVLCHLIGWFLPMYFAGRLESRNVAEYDLAASHAAKLGLAEFESELRIMARVEKEHEIFFLSLVAAHRLLPFARAIFGWGEAVSPAMTEARPDEQFNK